MALSLLSFALLTTSALAAPRPDVEVVQVRQVSKRQDTSIDLGDLASLLPTDIGDLASLIPTDVGDLASLLPTNLGDLIPTSVDLGDLSSLLPTDISSLDLSSLIGDIGTLIPSGCLPPSDLASPPTPPPDVASAILTYSDYCHAPSFTGDVGKHYSSYLSAASSWEAENGAALSSWISDLQSECPIVSAIPTGAGDISSLLASYSITLPSCGSATATSAKSTGGSASSGASKQTTSTNASTSGGSPASVSSFPGAAPQQTAFAAVAGVVAGFAGIVAAL